MKYQHITAGAAALILSSTSAFALTVTNTTDAAALAAATLSGTSGVTIVGGTVSLIGGATQQGTYSGFNLTSNTSDPDLSLTDGVFWLPFWFSSARLRCASAVEVKQRAPMIDKAGIRFFMATPLIE